VAVAGRWLAVHVAIGRYDAAGVMLRGQWPSTLRVGTARARLVGTWCTLFARY